MNRWDRRSSRHRRHGLAAAALGLLCLGNLAGYAATACPARAIFAACATVLCAFISFCEFKEAQRWK